jgi:hypothetical protein
MIGPERVDCDEYDAINLGNRDLILAASRNAESDKNTD